MMTSAPKMRPTSGDVDAFLAAIPGETRRADARTLCTLLADVTGEPAALWASGIIGFGTYRYRYESGHEGTAPLAGFAARKAHLVIYLIGGFEDRHHTVMAKLGSFKTGKGCLYLKRLADVDVDVLRDLVDRSVRVRRGVDRAAGTDQAP